MTDYPEVSPIEELLDGLYTNEIAIHGIKKHATVGTIALQGILPNCPDTNSPASFWTSGTRIFFSGDPELDGSTYDTSFFHYAHSASQDPSQKIMSMALATKSDLMDIDSGLMSEDFDKGYFAVKTTVPPSRMRLITVQEAVEGMSKTEARKSIERNMIDCLLRTVIEDYNP